MVKTDDISKLYNAMIKRGYNPAELGGSEDAFRKGMADKETRDAFYNWAERNPRNGFDIGSVDEYEQRITDALGAPAPADDKSRYTFTETELRKENPKPVASMQQQPQRQERAFAPLDLGREVYPAHTFKAPEPDFSMGVRPVDADKMVENSMQKMKQVRMPERKTAIEQGMDASREKAATELFHEKVQNEAMSAVADIEKRLAEKKDAYKPRARVFTHPMAMGSYVDYSPELGTLNAIDNVVNDTKKMVEDYHNRTGFFADAGRSMVDKAADLRTWDFGMRDASDAERMLSVVEKADKGQELNENEQLLLDAMVQQAVLQGYYQGKSAGQIAGEATAEMVPFMLQVAFNPVGGLGKAAASKTAKAVVKYIGKKYGTKAAMTKLLFKTLPAAARVGGDALSGYGAALTTGVGRTASDALSRQIGNIKTDFDAGGKALYDGREDAETAAEAWRDAVNSNAIEFFSESTGEYLAPILKPLGKAAGAGLEKMGLKGVSDFVKDYTKRGTPAVLKEYLDKTQWHGFFGEFGEEVAGGLMNAAIVGDQTVEEVLSKDNLVDTALGLSVASVLFPAIGSVNYGRIKIGERNNLKRAESAAKERFGAQWNDVRTVIANSESGADINAGLRELAKKRMMSLEDLQAAYSYADALFRYRAVEEVAMKELADGVMSSHERLLFDAYEQGADLPRGSVEQELEDARAKAARMTSTNVEDMDVSDVLAMAENFSGQGEQETADALTAYVVAKERWDGMNDAAAASLNGALAQSDERLARVTHKDGTVKVVTLASGERGYLVGGDVVFDAEGFVDVEKSPEVAYVIREGKDAPEMFPMENINEITSTPVEDVRAEQHARIRGQWVAENEPLPIDRNEGNNVAGKRAGESVLAHEASESNLGEDNGTENIGSADLTIPENGNIRTDNQGNPIDADGKLIVEEVASIDEITDEDFESPTRNVQLPSVPENVATAIGTQGRPVVIKKNVFEKNGNTHVELEPEDSRNILRSALYNPNIVGSTQPIKRPDYKVAIKTGEQNAVVVLDVYQGKNVVEIVGWRMVNEKGLAKMQRQAEREGGQFLILSPNDGSAAALSALPLGLSSASEGNANISKEQIPTEKRGKEERRAYHLVPVERTVEDLYNNGLEQQEIDDFVQANIDEINKDIESLEKKKPKMGANIDAYRSAKDEWSRRMNDLQERMRYYTALKQYIAGITRSDIAEALNESVDVATEITTPEEFVSSLLGGIKITPESFKRETGLSNTEQQGLVGIIASEEKGGVSVERAAEMIMENYGDALAGYGFKGDMQDVRDILIDILSGGNPKTYAKRSAEARAQAEREERKARMEAFTQVAFGMSLDDYIAYEETILPRIIEQYADFDEQTYYNILADENRNDYDTTRESESTGNGSEVLQGEQSVPAGGTPTVGAGEQGRTIPGDVQGGDENAVAQGERTADGAGSIDGGRTSRISSERESHIPQTEEVDDANAFVDAVREHTIEAYQRYLDNFQDGAYRDGARAGLWMLEGEDNPEHENAVDNAVDRAMGVIAKAGKPVGDSRGSRIESENRGSQSEETETPQNVTVHLTADEAKDFIADMELSADVAPEIDLTIENWDALFGESGTVNTPIGEVKMGENQFAKLMRQGREGKLGMIKPTLENPHAIVEEASEAKEGDTTERASSYIFIRSFKKADGSRFYYFTSITVSKDGKEVVVSSQEKSRNKILRLLQEGNVIWRTPKDTTTSSAERQGLDYEQPNKAETAAKGSGITPQSTPSDSKDTTISQTTNELGEKNAVSSVQQQVEAAEAEVNTNPTDKQKEAGNYKKGHVQIGTFNVTIEQPKGSVRSGVDKGGKKWEIEMQNTYGYIRGTEGVDGDHIDVFLSDDIDGWNGRQVYVVDQRNEDGSFDEHKVMLGFNDINDAEAAYLSNYEEGWQGLGAITGVAIEDFEKWIASSHRKTKAFAEYKTVKTTEGQSSVSKYGKYQQFHDEFIEGLNERKFIPNISQIRTNISQLKKKIKALESGMAMGVSSDEEFAKVQAAIDDATDHLNAYKDILDIINKQMKEAERQAAIDEHQTQQKHDDNMPYSIEPTQYTTKKGKVLDMHLVKFPYELRKSIAKVASSYAKEMKGWWDKSQGGFMMRNEEDAKRLAEYVVDAQSQDPVTLENVSMDDIQAVNNGDVLFTEPQQPKEQPNDDKYHPVWQYSIHVDADGYTTISRDDVSSGYPIGDARFRYSTDSPEEMLDILRNPLNGMQEALEAVGVTLENKIKTRELDRKIKEERRREYEALRTNGYNGYKIGDEVMYKGKKAKIHDLEEFGEHRPVLDTGFAPVMYEVAEWSDIAKVAVSQHEPAGYKITKSETGMYPYNVVFEGVSTERFRNIAKQHHGIIRPEKFGGGYSFKEENDAKAFAETVTSLGVKKPQQNQSASSRNGQDLTTGSSIDNGAVLNEKFPKTQWQDLTTTIHSELRNGTKISLSKEIAKKNLQNISKQYKGIKQSKGFISSLSMALGIPEGEHRQSFYFEFKDDAGNPYTLRISNHNVNGENIGENEKEISIVIKSRRQPNNFISNNADVKEYVYFKESIANGDGQTLAWIAQDIATMLDTGVYADNSGVAVVNESAIKESRVQPQRINVESLFGALNTKGEAKLSDHVEQQPATNPSGNRLVTDERYAELRERMRKKLGGQMNIGIDPEILAIGTEMAVYHLEKGARKFTEYAKAMIADLGDAIRPYLKAFYNGARNLPEVESSEIAADMTPYDEVQAFDVANFDKPFIDVIATAETVSREDEVVQEVEVARERIKKTRQTKVKTNEKTVNSQHNQLDLFNNGTEENTGTDNSGTQFGREELSETEQMGTRTPVQHVAKNSNGERGNTGNGSSQLGNGPRYDVNKNYTNEEIGEIVSSVTDIIDGKVVITGEVTDDIKAIARQYESGGVAKKGRGILDEYYTDGKIVDVVNMLITPYFKGVKGIRVLEPSVGVGNFIAATRGINVSEIQTFEINDTTARIAKVLYPDIDVNLRSFETEFIDDAGNKKPLPRKFSLVIGNPPYGSHRGLYKGLGEESKIARYEDYFVKRSLDVLEDGGVLAMVLPSSWMDRHTKFGGYAIETAYRLPSGAFEATQVGTDIVVLKKDSSVPVTEHTPYFEQHPERILGEVKQRKGRYGKMENYVEGDIDVAIEAIEREHAMQLAEQLDIEGTNDDLNDIQTAIEETGDAEKAKAIVESEKKAIAERKPVSKANSKQSKYKVELNRGVETAPTSSQFTHEFSEGEAEAFEDTDYDGTIAHPGKHSKYVNFFAGKPIHDFYYAEGDIYSKLSQLEVDKPVIVANYGIEQYEKQKRLLESVLPKRKGLNEITISPNTEFVKNLNVTTDVGTFSLKSLFIDFCRKLPYQAFGNSSSWEVIAYVNNEQVYGQDKQRNQLVRDRRKRVANDLFVKFLNEELSDEAKKQVVTAFNREYNSTYRPDYSRVPMFSTINKEFKGKDLKLTSVQLAGIGRMTVKGVGVLAHEVGFGKTLSGILAMHEAMTRGFAEKPLIVVPNDNILKQWVETIKEVLPQATVNMLGNLGTSYDLTDFKVNAGEFTIVTYEGLKAMSFSDDTYNRLADRFSYITEDLKKHQSERDVQKEIEKKQELKGKMKRGVKTTYGFEDFGFDWLTVDEVHNANHIVSKVRLDKSVASDFRSQSQRTSDLGLKTWLAAQYIQEENNGRNVLLLSATPFTNKPLEYYSILSLVANDMLRRKGFFNVDQFFATFMEADNDLEIAANGRPVQKTNIRRFRNNGLFQQLLSEFIDIKGEEDNPELVRPERRNKEYMISQNELTEEAMAEVQGLLSDNDSVLQGITHARAAAFSPYATSLLGRQPRNYKEFVKNSPKIDAAIKLIEQNKKDRPNAGQIIYSEVGVEFFPMICDYLVNESGFKPNEVRIITGATSNNERVNIQTAFNNGEVKVVIGSPAIKEGLNLQENTTDMYILSLPWNFTQLRQIEGRGWRQGNKWENIRINYMLTNDSVDVFMLQRLQIKQGLYNEAVKSGAESLDVSDIDTAELKTALITDPSVRAEIVTKREREKLEQEKIQIEADLSFVMRKYESYNKLLEKLNSQKDLVEYCKKYIKEGDTYWTGRVERAENDLSKIENDIEQEKQNLLKKGVNVDDIVLQTEQAQNAIEVIKKKIDYLKEYQEELAEKYRGEREAKADERNMLSTYMEERKAENNSGFYKIRPKQGETVADSKEEDDIRYRSIGGNSGYVGYSMSKRAARAREEGRFPKTDFKKEYGVPEKTFNALVDAGIIDNGEWHHTSKFGNKTTFYGWSTAEYADFYAEHKNEIDDACKGKNVDGSLFVAEVEDNPYTVQEVVIPAGYWDFRRSLENDNLTDEQIDSAIAERYPDMWKASENNRRFYETEKNRGEITRANERLIAERVGELFEEGKNDALFRGNALENGNNNLNLQQENAPVYENKDNTSVGGQVPQSVPQGEHGESTSLFGREQEATDRLGERIQSAQRNSESGLRGIENRVTREFAQENGLWIDNEFGLGTPFPSGDEHNNYIDAENRVIYKVNNRMHTPSILELLDRIKLHNKLFPDSKYSLVGFTAISENSDVLPVFAQDFVPDARMASIEEIDDYMSNAGFKRVANGSYSNGEVVVKDLKPRNVLVDESGVVYVVDAEFESAPESVAAAEVDKEITDAVNSLSKELNTPIEIVTDVDDIQDGDVARKRSAKGWYENGRVVIVLPNAMSVEDAVETVLHEVVGHKGLRALLGEEGLNRFLDDVFNHAPVRARREIMRRAMPALMRGNKNAIRVATEEYIAELAERGFDAAPSLWERIRTFFRDLLRSMGFDMEFDDREIRYMLWRSYQLMKNGQNVLTEVENRLFENNMNVGPMRYRAPEALSPTGETGEELKQQIETLDVRAEYEKALRRSGYQFRESMQDSMLVMKKFLKLIKEKGGKVLDAMNPYMMENALSSKNQAEMQAYAREFFSPILKILSSLKKSGMSLSDVCDYLMIKHGIERNREMAVKKAIENASDIEKVNSAFNKALESFTEENADHITFNLGVPSAVLRAAGVFAKPMKLYGNKVLKKMKKHGFGINELKDLPRAVAEPIAVFNNYGKDGNRAILTELRTKQGNFLVTIELGKDADVNFNIVTSVFGKGDENLIDWINRGLVTYIDKEKALAFLSHQSAPIAAAAAKEELSSATKIVESFENPKTEDSNSAYNVWVAAKHEVWKKGLEWEMEQRELDALAETFGANLKEDFSGLSEAFGKDFAEEAYDYVREVDGIHDMLPLHSAIRKATDAILDKQYNSSMMSKETMESIKGMFRYYVPLRGFNATTAEEVYVYLTSQASPVAKNKTMKGRTTKADSPIAWIGNMAESAIVQGNRNMVKNAFMNLVMTNPTDLVSVNRKVYVERRGNEATGYKWVVALPEIPETATPEEVTKLMKAHYREMEKRAQEHPDDYKALNDAKDIPYIVQEKRDETEHQIFVKRNGRMYMLTVNGNPRLAQAVNGLTNPDVDVSGAVGVIFEWGERVNRELSAFYTTRNPGFVASNFMRDMIYSNSMVWVKESPEYARTFNANCALCNPARIGYLIDRFEKGKLNMSNPVHRMFHEFIMNGGETGYTNLKDVEARKKSIAKEVGKGDARKGVDVVFGLFDDINRSIENCARFAAYMTSREMGRSITRSIWDAKEISVNFNKKGSGAKFLGKNGQTALGNTGAFVSGLGRMLYVFWNAGVQGLNNFGSAFVKHPVKTGLMGSAFMALGSMIAMLHPDGDDDDENDYMNLSEYVRRSNICFRVGSGYVTIPLPIEYRMFYGLGEYFANCSMGREDFNVMTTLGLLSQVMPIDMLSSGGMGMAFVPSWVLPFVQNAINVNWMGMPIAKKNVFNEDLPEYRRVYGNVSDATVEFSRMLNELGGGSRNRRAGESAFAEWWFEWNPAMLENLFNGFLGGWAQTMGQFVKTGETIFGDREYDTQNVPVLNRLYRNGSPRAKKRAVDNRYYDMTDRIEKFGDELRREKQDMKDLSRTEQERTKSEERVLELLSSKKDVELYVRMNYTKKRLKSLNKLYKATSDERYREQEYVIKRDFIDFVNSYSHE